MANASGRSWYFSIVTGAKVQEGCGISVYFLKGQFFFFAKASNLALGSTQLPISWVLETLARQRSGWGVNLTTLLRLLPILRLSEPISLLPLTP
jgi:hypothetical protein